MRKTKFMQKIKKNCIEKLTLKKLDLSEDLKMLHDLFD